MAAAVCVHVRLTEMTNQVTGEEQSSLNHLTGWPCGVHSSVSPAWAAKGAVPLSSLLQVRNCHSTKRSLSEGGCCGVENELEHKGQKVKEYSSSFQLLPSKVWIEEIQFLNVLREVGFTKAVCLVIHLVLEKTRRF